VKLREVFRYELEHRLRGVSTWLYAAILFGLSFLLVHAHAEGDALVHVNAPERLATLAVGLGLAGLLVSAALFGDAAVRDAESGMDALLFTAPLRKAEYLGGRFLAALAVNAAVVAAIPLGLAAATRMPYLDAGAFGPFRAAPYVQAYLLFQLPNLVLTGAVLFAIGVLARGVVPVYLGAIALFVGYLLAIGPLAQAEQPMLVLLGDPFGIGALNERVKYWTETERNTRLVGFAAPLVWNRAIWLTVAIATLAALHRRFRFAHPDGGGRRGDGAPADAASPARARPLAVPRVAGSFGVRTTARQTLAVARASLAEVAGSRSFAVVLAGAMALALLFGWEVGDSVFETSIWPVTVRMAEQVLNTPLVPISYVLIALYAGELVWKDREVGAAEIADATPVPEGAALLGRFLALVPLLAMFQAAIAAGCILVQALQGYHRFEVGLYARIFLGLNLASLVLLAALAMAVHVVVNHKYLGHFAVLLACLLPTVLREYGVVRHHLLLYGTDPGWTYSDMNGFGPYVGPFVWFKLYWAAWALLLGVGAALLWVRGRESGARHRLRQARARFRGAALRAAGAAAGLILALGGFIFYNTNVLNHYRGTEEAGAEHARRETRYGRFADAPQPTIAAAALRVEIHPERPAVELRGSYLLVNRTGAAIDSVHVYLDPGIEVRSLSFDRAATPVVVDAEAGYRIHALARALAPGDSLRLAFDVAFRPRGFPNGGIQTDVSAAGARFDRRWLPFVGYQRAFELTDDESRRRVGLAPRPPVPGPDDTVARRYRGAVRDADLVDVDAVIGTAADQVAVTPGVLRRSWTKNGRRYFHYRTEAPVSFGATVFSGRYAVREGRWNDVALRVYHHPAHDWNVDRTLRAMKASLDYYTREFGPYPDRELRVVEFARYGGFGIAHPHTIGFSEDYFHGRVRAGKVDQPSYGTAHEVAHQWWGGAVKGAAVRGHGFLSESLANYSAMMVTETTYGPEAARLVYDFQMDRYLAGRARFSREVPLLDVEDQPYIAYRKGAIAMYTLRREIGEARVNAALRRYAERYRGAGPPYPAARDLYAELRAVTPAAQQGLLRDLFETVTLWEVEARQARVERTGGGAYRVTLDVAARKLRADSAGRETEVPMDDLVEIGVFAPGEDGGRGAPLHLARHRIRSGRQTITVTVPRQPALAGIDPYRRLIDRRRDDNLVEVRSAAPAASPAPGGTR
jgi:hypothetical protein